MSRTFDNGCVTGLVGIIIFLTVLCFQHFTGYQPAEARRVLEQQGYKNVVIESGRDWFSCADSDWFATGFSATSPAGVYTRGTVCSGLLVKSTTVRFK